MSTDIGRLNAKGINKSSLMDLQGSKSRRGHATTY